MFTKLHETSIVKQEMHEIHLIYTMQKNIKGQCLLSCTKPQL